MTFGGIIRSLLFRIYVFTILILPCFLLNALYYLPYTVDDAFISFRYARNLVDGHGLVYNPGQYVEGFSNFSWVMLAALVLKVGLPLLSTMKMIGLAAGVGTLALTTATAWRLGGGRTREPPGRGADSSLPSLPDQFCPLVAGWAGDGTVLTLPRGGGLLLRRRGETRAGPTVLGDLVRPRLDDATGGADLWALLPRPAVGRAACASCD